MLKDIDFVVVGSGIYGSTISKLLSMSGKRVLILESNNFVGGLCREELVGSIWCHKYGPHIFHTSNEKLWEFVNRFCKWELFEEGWKVIGEGKRDLELPSKELFTLPINLHTIEEVFPNCKGEEQCRNKIKEEVDEYLKDKPNDFVPSNLEELGIMKFGTTIYKLLIEGYTWKQWRTNPKDLPKEIIERLDIRYNYDDRYFIDTYQGVPSNYNTFFNNLLDDKNIEVVCNQIFNGEMFKNKPVIYTGIVENLIPQQLLYTCGYLGYLETTFGFDSYDSDFVLGHPIINECWNNSWGSTRRCEYKLLHPNRDYIMKLSESQIGIEHTRIFNPKNNLLKHMNTVPTHPINTKENNELYNKYKSYIKEKYPNIILGGRMGLYKYLNMDKCMELAYKQYKELI